MKNDQSISKPWGEYARLRPHEIAEIMSKHPIAYLPWGAIEWHSYHNPVGLDGYIAEAQCRALAQRNGGLVFPTVFAGTDTIKPFKGFKYTVEHQPSTVSTLCSEWLQQLSEEGFLIIVLVTGHAGGGHTDALKSSIESFRDGAEGTDVIFWASFEPIKHRFPMNHAANGETSLQLFVDHETVDLAMVPAGEPPTLDEDGVWGSDPRNATIENGEAIMSLFVEIVSQEIESLIEQEDQ